MLIITREALLEMAKISPGREVRRSHQVIKAAHKAGTKDRPDWQARLKAAELNLRVMDAFPKPTVQPVDASRPVNVVFVLTQPGAADLVQADGLTLSLGVGGGEGA